MAKISLPSSAGDVSTDLISDEHIQLVKVTYGDGLTATRVTDGAPLPVQAANEVDSNNSTSTPLGGAAVFTGTSTDVTRYSSISVIVDTDVDGTLSMQFSADNSNWDRARSVPVTVADAGGQIHVLSTIAQYFRVVYTNGSGAQSYMRLQTILHGTRSAVASSLPNQLLTGADNVQLVRVISDPMADVSRGLWADRSAVHKFGINLDLGTTERDVWQYGGAGVGNIDYPWPTTTETLDISSDNVNDDAAGTGARKIQIEGLDDNFDQISEEIALSTGATVTTTASFRRVNRAFVTDVGTYTGNNLGNITIQNTSSAQVIGYIGAGAGQTRISMYTVPANYTAYMRQVSAEVTAAANKEADVTMWRRLDADVITPPYSAKRLVHEFVGLNGFAEHQFPSHVVFPPKTDIWMSAVSAGSGSKVDVTYCLFLFKNDTSIALQ